MIVYNLTIKVSLQIAEKWLDWLQLEHIPEVMNTGCFTEFSVLRLLEVDDADGPTYAVQFKAVSKADYNRYIELHAPELRQKSYDAWGDQFLAFRSVMQVVL